MGMETFGYTYWCFFLAFLAIVQATSQRAFVPTNIGATKPSIVAWTQKNSLSSKVLEIPRGGNAEQLELPNVLLVGVTGTTGLRAIQGFLDVGYAPQQLFVVTRNQDKPKIQQLQKLGFNIVQANLEDTPEAIQKVLPKNLQGSYIHSTTPDMPELDTLEVTRAQNLCKAFKLYKGGKLAKIVYNSSAADPGHGIARIQQKHDVEQVFAQGGSSSFVGLRANIFMEEVWKKYTRPAILGGKYPLPVPFWRRIYWTSVRDMGRLAGTLLSEKERLPNFQTIDVAGDCLRGGQLARRFAKAQGNRVKYFNNRKLTRQAKKNFPDLYEQIWYLQTSTAKTDIPTLKARFASTTLTSFAEFLDETQWVDSTKSYEDMTDPTNLVL